MEGARRGRRRALRGRAGRAARHRPRHLSVRHVVQPGRGERGAPARASARRTSTRSRASPRRTPRASARARSRPSSTTSSATRSARPAASTARRPGARAAWLVRPRRPPLRGAAQHAHRPGDHEARRAHGRPAPRLHALPHAGPARLRPTSPTTRRSCTSRGRVRGAAGLGRATSRRPRERGPARDGARLPRLHRDFVGVPIALVGVGPGRDQVIWTEAGRQTAPAQRAVHCRGLGRRSVPHDARVDDQVVQRTVLVVPQRPEARRQARPSPKVSEPATAEQQRTSTATSRSMAKPKVIGSPSAPHDADVHGHAAERLAVRCGPSYSGA